jgi:hypothetical protein
MKFLFSAEGVRNLQTAWILLAASIATAVGIVFGSHWYLDREKRESTSGAQRLQEARSRLDAARRERDTLQDSADTFRTLVERGMLQGERRLDLIELVNTLRARHQLYTLDYDVGAQRPLLLPGGRAYAAIDVLASRVKLRMRALHEGDVVAFIDELTQSHQGFYPLDRCTLRRIDVAGADMLLPRVEAECAFEWVTLKDKNANRPA